MFVNIKVWLDDNNHIVDDQDVRRPFLGEADEHFQNEHESNNGGDSAGEGDDQQGKRAVFTLTFTLFTRIPPQRKLCYETSSVIMTYCEITGSRDVQHAT